MGVPMKTLRGLALAAALAAVCVLPVLAGPDGGPGPCVPGTPSCPLDPPQSIQVNPHPLNADGTSVGVPTSGEVVPVEGGAPMPGPRFVGLLALGWGGEGGGWAPRERRGRKAGTARRRIARSACCRVQAGFPVRVLRHRVRVERRRRFTRSFPPPQR